MGLEASLAVARARHAVAVLLGHETAADFLTRREPTFAVGQWAATNLPTTARVIGQDHRGFYIPRDYTMELAHRRRTGLGGHGETSREIVAKLCDSGFTHIMFCPPVPETAVEFDPTLGRLLDPWVAERTPVFRQDLSDGDGVLRQYFDLRARSRCALGRSPPEESALGAVKRGLDAMKSARPTIAELRAQVQKDPSSRNWQLAGAAVARPTAVYGCWLAIRLGLSAHQVTVIALCSSLAAAVADRHGATEPVRRWGCTGPSSFWMDHVG